MFHNDDTAFKHIFQYFDMCYYENPWQCLMDGNVTWILINFVDIFSCQTYSFVGKCFMDTFFRCLWIQDILSVHAWQFQCSFHTIIIDIGIILYRLKLIYCINFYHIIQIYAWHMAKSIRNKELLAFTRINCFQMEFKPWHFLLLF